MSEKFIGLWWDKEFEIICSVKVSLEDGYMKMEDVVGSKSFWNLFSLRMRLEKEFRNFGVVSLIILFNKEFFKELLDMLMNWAENGREKQRED